MIQKSKIVLWKSRLLSLSNKSKLSPLSNCLSTESVWLVLLPFRMVEAHSKLPENHKTSSNGNQTNGHSTFDQSVACHSATPFLAIPSITQSSTCVPDRKQSKTITMLSFAPPATNNAWMQWRLLNERHCSLVYWQFSIFSEWMCAVAGCYFSASELILVDLRRTKGPIKTCRKTKYIHWIRLTVFFQAIYLAIFTKIVIWNSCDLIVWKIDWETLSRHQNWNFQLTKVTTTTTTTTSTNAIQKKPNERTNEKSLYGSPLLIYFMTSHWESVIAGRKWIIRAAGLWSCSRLYLSTQK